MQILIKITEEQYDRIKFMNLLNDDRANYLRSIILNGTPLPEHHGDLVDRYELKRAIVKDPRKALSLVDLADFVWLAPTIIEAEGSDSE